jgi:M6 family metalloprotease-like protein
MRALRLVTAVASAALLFPAHAAAQQPARRWEPRGFEFSPNGVWRRRSAQVRAARLAALARGDLWSLNAPLQAGALMAAPGTAQPTAMAVTGTLREPVFLVTPKNLPAAGPFPASQYTTLLFGNSPPAGRPFTIQTFYEQMSNGLLSVQGTVLGWIGLDSNDTWYEGSSSCNGLCASAHIPQLMREAVQKTDTAVDFGQFDNDGPDGIPNSGDDDGIVDLAVFIQPEIGGECGGNNNIWSHRFWYSGYGLGALVTNDPRRDAGGNPIPGQFIVIDDYTIQSGVGGSNYVPCDPSAIMPIGTIAHETGHGFDLPDLYDTNPSDGDDSEGIGEWGLMSSGSYASPLSPAHMEGWSRLQLGWVTTRDLTTNGTYTLGGYTVGDTIFRVTPTVPNPRGEYFLIESREPQLGDTALLAKRGSTGGLLIYHVDGQQIQAGTLANTVNSGSIHGLWLLQADGLNQLRSSTPGVRNRGDAGDPYPGTTQNRSLSFNTNPDDRLNAGGAYSGFAIDSIRKLADSVTMSMRVRFGALTVVRAADSGATIRFRGASTAVVRDLFADGDTATVDIDSVQIDDVGATQFLFQSWSDGGARTHQVTLSSAGDTLIAALTYRYRATFTPVGGGSILVGGGTTSGTFLDPGDSVLLTAQSPAGISFIRWTGDTTTTQASLVLRMNRPWTVVANFQAQLAVADTVLRPGVMGAPYADTLRMTGGSGTYAYTRVAGTLPPGLTLTAAGIVSGVPAKDSTYTFTVRVGSAGQQLDLPMAITVTAPTLVPTAVVDQLLQGGTALTADEQRFMDLQGNANGNYDIGDVTAWFDDHPGLLTPAVLRRLARWGHR